MGARRAILATALVFVGVLGALTVYVAITSGITVLTPVALLVLGLFGSGVVGALLRPPPED